MQAKYLNPSALLSRGLMFLGQGAHLLVLRAYFWAPGTVLGTELAPSKAVSYLLYCPLVPWGLIFKRKTN